MSDKPGDAVPSSKRPRTLTDDDVIVGRSGRERAIAQIGGGPSASTKLATDPHGPGKPPGGGASSPTDADQA